MGRKKKNSPNIPKNLPETAYHAMQAMGSEELKATVVASTFEAAERKRVRDADPVYVDAKEDYKALAGGYNDVIKAEKAKADFALELLQGRGVSLSREDLMKTVTAVPVTA